MKKLQLILYSILLSCVLPITAQAQHKLTMHFTNMGPHLNQTLNIRVYDKATAQEVGYTSTMVVATEFDVDLYVLIDEHSYWIDFFADHNSNGAYDAPPTDHAWRLELNNSAGDEELTFSHNANFVDINWQSEFTAAMYAGVWEGYWHNLTYDTTDSLTMLINMDEEQNEISGSLTTAGAFGNPEMITFNFQSEYQADADTIRLQFPAPWQGELVLANGEIHGMMSDPTLFGVGLTLMFQGSYGISQMIMTYEMSGAFTANGVVWAMRDYQTTTGVEKRISAAPQDFTLAQNYPNPFNPSTTIAFSLPQADHINITIFNMQGQLVNTLVNANLQPGLHSIMWNAIDAHSNPLPSGVYYYQLRTSTNIQTNKMLLIK